MATTVSKGQSTISMPSAQRTTAIVPSCPAMASQRRRKSQAKVEARSVSRSALESSGSRE